MIVDLALVTVLTLASGAAFAASGDALDVQVSPSIHARLRASEVDEATGTARSKATSALHTRLFDYVNGNANAAWRQAVAALEPRWNAFVQVILDWESRVKALVRKIGAYLDRPTGDCSEVIKLYCDGVGVSTWR